MIARKGPGNPRYEGEGLEAEEMSIDCLCGRPVTLNALEGYEAPTFAGSCVCGRVWSLAEISAQVDPDANGESQGS